MEKTDTSGYDLKPTGTYILEIERVIKSTIGKEGGKQYPGYKWFFEIRQCDHELEDNNFTMFMFKSQMGDILRAVGAKETDSGVFEWDMESVREKIIECELVHVDVKGTLREQLIEIKPIKEQLPPKTEKEVAWDD